MNVGQVLETHLGWVAKSGWKIEGNDDWQKTLRANGFADAPANTKVATPVFDGAKEEELTGLLASTLPNKDGMRLVQATGKAQLFDGRTGEPYKQHISVGYMYILKLHHLVDDKIQAIRITLPLLYHQILVLPPWYLQVLRRNHVRC